jgi:hypothetical protein
MAGIIYRRRKSFFFEKKHQKTFATLARERFSHVAKVFCGAFFQKSDRLLNAEDQP